MDKPKDKLIFEGIVKTYEKQTFVLDDNHESIHGWIHKHAKDLEGKRIRIILEEIEPKNVSKLVINDDKSG